MSNETLTVSEEVRQFHDDCLVFMAYVVTPLRLTRSGASLLHMAQRNPGPSVDLPKLKAGGVDAAFLSVGVDRIIITGDAPRPGDPWPVTRAIFRGPAEIKRTLWGIEAFHQMVEANRDTVELALCAEDVERIVRNGKLAAILHLTVASIDDDLSILQTYHRLGARAIQIVYDESIPTWGDSSQARDGGRGLTKFGYEVIREMNRLGMMIDLAHASDRTYEHVIEASEQPVISSHSGARAVCDLTRNVPDEIMRKLAARDGIMGMYFGSNYLDEGFLKQPGAIAYRQQIVKRNDDLAKEFAEDPLGLAVAMRAPRPNGIEPPPRQNASMETLLAHFNHCVSVVGDEHICLGSDFGGVADEGVIGLDEPSKCPNLTAALLDQGYSREATRRILGENLLRLFGDVVGC
jgi:membrane dipeptidase